MDIQFNTDNRVDGTTRLNDKVMKRIHERLDPRFAHRLTRIEVHIRDIDGDSNGPSGIEVTLEARPSGGQPIEAVGRGDEPVQAVNVALGKLVSRLDSVFGKADRVRK